MFEKIIFTAWITKYALTRGVYKLEVEQAADGQDGKYVYGRDRYSQQFVGEGKEWHRTPEAALQRADDMRKEKIASLRKQIKKLEGIVFETDEA